MRAVERFTVVVVVATMLFGLASNSGAGAVVVERRAVLHQTNLSRDRHDLLGLRINETLSALARAHSVAMARRGTLFHTADPASAYLRGISWHVWGENVGETGGTASDLQHAFMVSPPHRENILSTSYHRVAIGAVRVNGVLWVTVFFYG